MARIAQSLASTGQFCTVTFVKENGEIRTINGRTGVKKYLKGNKRSVKTEELYLLLWTRNGSNKFDAARNIARDRIISIKAHGVLAKKNNLSEYAQYV